MTNTSTTALFTSLLNGVRRHNSAIGCLLYEDEVLTALTAALDPALTERAGEVLEQLGLFVKPQWSTGAPAYVCKTAANALLRAFASTVGSYEADMHPMTRDSFNRVSAHLGAKP